VKVGEGKWVKDVDAYAHGAEERLWRYSHDDKEYMWDVFDSNSQGAVYVGIKTWDLVSRRDGWRVAIVNAQDGSTLCQAAVRDVTRGANSPCRLTRGRLGQQTVLFLLWWWSNSVMLYAAGSCLETSTGSVMNFDSAPLNDGSQQSDRTVAHSATPMSDAQT